MEELDSQINEFDNLLEMIAKRKAWVNRGLCHSVHWMLAGLSTAIGLFAYNPLFYAGLTMASYSFVVVAFCDYSLNKLEPKLINKLNKWRNRK